MTPSSAAAAPSKMSLRATDHVALGSAATDRGRPSLDGHATLRRAAAGQRSWQMWWQQDVWTPDVRQGAKHYLQVCGTTLGGCALAGVSALVSAPTVVPPLLALTEATVGASGLFDGVFIIGPILSSAIGLGGIFGYVSMAAVLSAVVATLFTSAGRTQTQQAWLLSHLALGFAVAPLLCVGTALSAPVSLCTWACVAGLSFLLSCRLHAEQPSWQTAMLGVFFALGTAPMGAVAALGMGPAAVVGNAIKFIATGGISCVIYYAWLNWSQLVNNSTAQLDAAAMPATDAWRLPMAHGPTRASNTKLAATGDIEQDAAVQSGTVFGTPENVENFIWTLETYMQAVPAAPLGTKRLLLSGPDGVGKTVMVQGMAHFLKLPLFAPIVANLEGAENTALSVLNLFEQAHTYTRAHGKPVILFFDRTETLFVNRATLNPNSAADREVAGVINVFLTCLDGVNRNDDTNLIVVAATHAPDKLDPSLLQRFSCHGRVQRPTRTDLHNLLTLRWEQMQADPALRAVPRCDLSQAVRDRVVRQAAQAQLVGRDIDALIDSTIQSVSAQHVQHTQKSSMPKAAFDAERVMVQALEASLAQIIARAAGTGEDALAPQPNAPAAMVGANGAQVSR